MGEKHRWPLPASTTSTSSNTGGTSSQGGGRPIYITINIASNDPSSFIASSSQIANSLRRAVLSATSHSGP